MNMESLLVSAQRKHKQGKYLEAEREYLQLLNNGFQAEAMLKALTNVCILSNSIDRAIEYLTQLSVMFPKDIAYCEALASLYTRTQDWNGAANCYGVFVAHNPRHADAHYNYAYNLKLASKFQEAINAYQASLDNRVDQPEEVLTNMAVIYSEHLRLESKAMESLEMALQVNPNYTPAMFNLATLYEEEGNKNKAALYYQSILKLKPNDCGALVRLAEAQRVTESDASIIKSLQLALSDSNVDADDKISLNFALGKVLDECGQYDLAFKHYYDANQSDQKKNGKYSRDQQEQLVQENISFFNEQWFSQLTPVSDAEPIFICGMFRSGSTLIEQILASHSKVTAGGEMDFFVRLGLETIPTYPNGINQLSASDLHSIANKYLSDLSRAFPDAAFITDKRPDNFLYIGIIKTLFPRAKIIHSKRQRLDNCLSVYFLRASASIDYATDLVDIAHYYKQYEQLMAYWESLFGNDIYLLSYDNLVAEPEFETRGLLNFLGLDWEPECLKFHRIKNRVKTASIWQVRQQLYRKSSGRWENYEPHIASLIEAFDD